MRINLDELTQRPVVDATGRIVGSVDKLVVDTDDWRVKALRIKLRRNVARVVRTERHLFRARRIDVPSDKVQGVGDAVLLRVDAKDLAGESSDPARS